MTWFYLTLAGLLLLFAFILYFIVKSTKEQMEEKLKAQKRQLTSNIAHEIRTPLASVRGYLETLVEMPEMDEAHKRQFIERAYSQTIRLSNLITDISLITKIEQDPAALPKEYIGVRKLVDDIVTQLSGRISEKGVKVENEIGEEVSVRANQPLLYATFRNLIENSLRYAGQDFTINISCDAESDDKLHFRYYDTGKGIDAKELEKIFERFYRVKGSSNSEGSGLGLSIVKNAVEYHGGHITASEHKGGGLEFNFYLTNRTS